MARYAEGTSVSSDRSRLELEKLLRRFGADQFATAWDDSTGTHMVAFRMGGRQVRLDERTGDALFLFIETVLSARPEVLAAAMGGEVQTNQGTFNLFGHWCPGTGRATHERTVIVLPPQEVGE